MSKILIEVIKVVPYLKRMTYFIPKKAIVPIYESFLITVDKNTMDVFAFDGIKSIRSTFRCESDAIGSWAVPAKLLTDTLNLINDPMVTFDFTETHLVIKNGRKNISKIHIHPGKDYPQLRVCNKNNEISYSCSDFKKDALNMVEFTDKDSPKPFSQGVNMKLRDGSMFFEGANDFIIGQVRTEPRSILNWSNVLVPGDILKLVADSLDDRDIIKIYHDTKQILFSSNNYEISSTLIDHPYPDIDSVFDKFPKGQYAKTDNYQTELAFKKIKLYSQDDIPFLCAITFSGNEMKVDGIDKFYSNEAQEYVDIIDNQGVDCTIAVRADQLLSVVKSIGDGDILFFVNDPSKPVYMRTAASDNNRFLISAIQR